MNTGGDAAEQIVRMSLEGFEVAAKLTGAGAKNIAVLLYSILKEEQKTKGKARLTSMLRSGKELKVFTIKNEDLKRFTQEAKKYGVVPPHRRLYSFFISSFRLVSCSSARTACNFSLRVSLRAAIPSQSLTSFLISPSLFEMSEI